MKNNSREKGEQEEREKEIRKKYHGDRIAGMRI
jgi:hypothetical protein